MGNNLQSQTINWLRFPLIVLVVFIHNQGKGTSLSDVIIPWGAMQGTDYYNLLRLFITSVFARIAVPTFFIISGYLFFIKIDSFNYRIYKSKIRQRIKISHCHLLILIRFAFFGTIHVTHGKMFLGGSIVCVIPLIYPFGILET